MSDCSFTQRILNIHESVCVAVWFVTWLVPRDTAAVSAQVQCTTMQFTVALFEAA